VIGAVRVVPALSVQVTDTVSPGSWPASTPVRSSAEPIAVRPTAVMTSPAARPAESAGPPETTPAIAAFLRYGEDRRGAPLRLVPTRANSQPAFGCYLPDARTGVSHPRGLMVLTLAGEEIAAVTWFGDVRVFGHFGLPPTLLA